MALSCATGSHPPETPEAGLLEPELPPLPELEARDDDGLLVEVPLRTLRVAILHDEQRLALIERRQEEVLIVNGALGDWEAYATRLEKQLLFWQIIGSVSTAALVGLIAGGFLW